MRLDPIETKRLILEPFGEKFITAAYVSWLNDPEVVKYSEQRHRTHSSESCRDYFNSIKDSSDAAMWAIIKKDDKVHIGNINVYIDNFNGTGDVGILIGERSSWGRGFGSESFSALTNYLLEKVSLRKVTAGCMGENKGMIKIMEKTGMKPDGVKKGQFIVNGKEVDAVYMAVFNKGYRQR